MYLVLRLVGEVGEIQESIGLLNDKLREAQTVHQVKILFKKHLEALNLCFCVLVLVLPFRISTIYYNRRPDLFVSNSVCAVENEK